MSTKIGYEQHNVLHQHFPNDCCLCRTESEIRQLKEENSKLNSVLSKLPDKDELYEIIKLYISHSKANGTKEIYLDVEKLAEALYKRIGKET